MPTIDFLADEQAAKDFDFQPEETPTEDQPLQMPTFEPTTAHATPTAKDIQDFKREGSIVSNFASGLNVAGKGLIAGLGDLGEVMFRPVTDELYPEQAVPGAIHPENIEALSAGNELPARNLASLPRSLQFTGHAAQGLIETAPKVAAVGAMQSVGIPAPLAAGAVFGATEEGFDPVQGAVAAALPYAGRLSGGVAGAVAKKLGVSSTQAINWIKSIAGTAGPAAALVAQGEAQISKLPKEQQESARIQLWEGIAGQAALGPMGVKFEKPGSVEGAVADARVRSGVRGEAMTDEQYVTHEREAIDEAEKLGSPADAVDEFSGQTADEPFAGQFMRPTEKGMEIRKGNFRQWLENIPADQREAAITQRVLEEHIHRHTSAEDAAGYYGTLTGLEKAIEHRAYTGEWTPEALQGKRGVKFSDTQLGHEAIRRRMQRLMGGQTSEIAEAALRERWTLKSLDALSSLVRNVRETVGTKASRQGLELLSKLDDNLSAARAAISGQQPAAFQKAENADLEKVTKMTGPEFMDVSSQWTKDSLAGKGLTTQVQAEQAALANPDIASWEKAQADHAVEARALMDELKANPSKMMERQRELMGMGQKAQFFSEGLKILRGQKPEPIDRAAAFQKELPMGKGEPGDRPSAADLGAKPFTARELEQSGAEHLQAETARVASEWAAGKKPEPPTFKDYRDTMVGKYGDLKPGQLFEGYQDALYKRLLSATGPELEAMAKSLGVKANRVADAAPKKTFALDPEGMTGEARARLRDETKAVAQRERYRNLVVSRVAEKMLADAAPETKAPTRTSVSPEDLRQNDATKEPGFVDITPSDAAHPEILAQRLVRDARRSNRDPVTLTKRLTALQDKQTGKVHLVSTYPHGRSGAMLVDPSVSTIRAHRPLSSILDRYRPVASLLLDEPVQNFRQNFKSLGEFESKFATDARRASQQTFEAPLAEGEAPEPGSWEKGGPITDAEAGAILDHVTSEVGTFDSVDDVKASLSALSEDTNFQALSGYRKLANELLRRNPDLSDSGLINQLAQNIYETHQAAPDYEAFVKRTMGQGTPESRPSAPVRQNAKEVATGRELTLPRFARKSVPREPLPPKVLRGRKRDDYPAAFQKLKDAAKEQWDISTDDIRTVLSRRDVKQEIPAILDGADASSRQVALNAKSAIILASTDKTRPAWEYSINPASKMSREQRANAAEATQRRKAAIPYIAAGKTDAQGNWQANKSRIVDWRAKLDIAEAKARTWTQDINPLKRREGRKWMEAVKEMQAAVDYAETNWTDRTFVEGAQQYRKEVHDAIAFENANGSTTVERDNYIPGLFNGDYFAGKRLLGTRYRMPKKFQNPYDAIAAGPYYLASQDVANLADTRILAGRRSVERQLWTQALTGLKDPATGNPVAKQPVMAMKNVIDPATGLTSKEPVWQSPSPEYPLVYAREGSKPIAVHKGYERLVRTLIRPSVIEDMPLGKEALALTGVLKHGAILLLDTFHLGRLAQYTAALTGFKGYGYRGGHSALTYRDVDLPRAVERGYISRAAADWAQGHIELTSPSGAKVKVTRKAVADEMLRQGLNAARITDALYKDAVQNIPFLGEPYHKLISPYNKFLFDRFMPGVMLESAVRNLEKYNQSHPNVPLPKLARDVVRDINVSFGNMGRQGIFKSATFRDLAQLIFLAPSWQEGLIRKELSGGTRLAALPLRGAAKMAGKELPFRKGLPALGTTGSMMVKGLGAYFILSQMINLATKGHFTWQNEEEGHKLDAWLPIGGKGVWLNPMSVFAETTHDVIRLSESKPTVMDAITQMGENRLGPIGKMATILGTGKAPTGEQYTTSAARLRGGVSQITPFAGASPIAFSTPAREIGHAIMPNQIAPNQPGTVPRQALSTLAGIKVQAGQTQLNQAYKLAQNFMEREGLKKDTGWVQVMTDDPSYTQLRRQLRNDDKAGAAKTFEALVKSHHGDSAAVIKAMRLWAKHPLTGSAKNENLFLQSLSDKELETYTRANEERQELLNNFFDFVNQLP